MKIVVAVVPLLLALPAVGQRLLHTHTLPTGWFLQHLRSAGDANGDGYQDFVALVSDLSNPITPIANLMIVSGRTGVPLQTVADPALQDALDVQGFGDVNGDGRSDIVALRYNALRVYSGSTGAMLYSLAPGPSGDFTAVCPVGDHNGNGTADLAVATYINGTTTVRLLRGENGSLLQSLLTVPNPNAVATLCAMGDLTGDGKSEVAIATPTGSTYVLHAVSGAVLWSLSPTGGDNSRTIDTLDLDGDGKRELFFFRSLTTTVTTVHDAVSGALRFTLTGAVGSGIGRRIAGLGDLNQDGKQDFATAYGFANLGSVRAWSGNDGRRLWSQTGWQPGYPIGEQVVAVGDVDADGHGDFVENAVNGFVADSWHLLSGKVLAEAQPQLGACGGGPFFPRLGATRPILGQVMTIAGQDGPVGVGGVLVFSLQPAAATWLGASSCYAWFDLGAGIALAPLTQPQWTLALPLPLVPQFAGIEIALQSFYSPTSGPLGYDLGNGVWARLGYQ